MYIGTIILVSILLAIIVPYLSDNQHNTIQNELKIKEKILENLRKQGTYDKILLKNVAIGYNTNLDLVCPAVEIFNSLSLKPPTRDSPSTPFEDFEAISSPYELVSTFSHYFSQGSAAERYLANSTVPIFPLFFLNFFNFFYFFFFFYSQAVVRNHYNSAG